MILIGGATIVVLVFKEIWGATKSYGVAERNNPQKCLVYTLPSTYTPYLPSHKTYQKKIKVRLLLPTPPCLLVSPHTKCKNIFLSFCATPIHNLEDVFGSRSVL